MFHSLTSLNRYLPIMFWCGVVCVINVTGCAEDSAESVDEQISEQVADTSQEGDGRVDNYDYGSTDAGHFTDLGVWEQEPDYCIPTSFPAKYSCEGEETGMWAEALQMALWFFSVNKSGDGVSCTDVQWRGDAHTDDAHIQLIAGAPNGVNVSDAYIRRYQSVLDPKGLGEIDLSGGYYDGGSFIKFGLTAGYMVSTLSWAMYEFPETFSETGLGNDALTQIKWAADYFMKNTFVTDRELAAKDWDVVAYAYQVGDISDRDCGWMPPELRDASVCPRRGYLATKENPVADVTANNAAALAQVALVTSDDDEYSARALRHAIALYEFAKIDPTLNPDNTNGTYVSEYAWDELAWAAVWLYEATKESEYLDEALGWLYRVDGFDENCVLSMTRWSSSMSDTSTCWNESWTHSWNSVRSGVFLRLAVALGDAATVTDADEHYSELARLFQNIARIDSEAWLSPQKMTPQGFSNKVNVDQGSGHYNAAGQLVALAYARNFPEDELSASLVKWADTQSRYLLGDNQVNGNPDGKSFVMGFTALTDNYAAQPYHAAGHASIYGLADTPVENRHTLWGALVNGPIGNDTHTDARGDTGANQVSISYNAALVGALAGNFYYNNEGLGQCPNPDFPPQEQPVDEFYTMGKKHVEAECRTQVWVTMMNESVHPPRYNEFLTARYYFNVSELVAAGEDPSTVSLTIRHDDGRDQFGVESPTTISGPFKCEDQESEDARDMWYFVLSYEDQRFWGSQTTLQGPRNTLVDFGVEPMAGCVWDPTNDWSYEGIESGSETKSPHITAYGEDAKLLWGEEPPCHPIQHVLKDLETE